MTQLAITFDKAQLARADAMLRGVPGAIRRAQYQAVKRTVTGLRAAIVKAVAEDLAIKRQFIYEKGNYRRPVTDRMFHTTGDSAGGQVSIQSVPDQGGISDSKGAKYGRIPLSRFSPTQRKPGVSYRIGRQGGRKTVAGTFLATMRSGHTLVGRRVGKARYPIAELFGPSVFHVARNRPEVQQLLAGGADAILRKNLENQIARVVDSKGTGGGGGD